MKTLLVSLSLLLCLVGCEKSDNDQARTSDDVQRQVIPATSQPSIDGIALAVIVDCSGSMADRVSDGVKIDIAHAAVHKIFEQAQAFSKARNTPVKIALYRFSDAPQRIWPATQPFATPDASGASASIDSLTPSGGTAIGEAVIAATKDLNQSGYSSVNVLVVTDGENNQGTSPDDVSAAFSHLKDQYKPKVFIVAFDTNASIFNTVKANGWKVLSASNGAELSNTLDTLVGGEILLEK